MAQYPTPAGHRMAHDRDGSVWFFNPTAGSGAGTVSTLSTAQMQAINSEAMNLTSYSGAQTLWAGVVFPELRDIVGYFLSGYNDSQGHTMQPYYNLSTSTDTTNGMDGTWTVQNANPPYNNSPGLSPYYRNSIQSVNWTGIKAVRVQNSTNYYYAGIGNLHLYGQPSANQNPDSLRIWQPVTNAEIITVEDFGDIARGTSTTFSFRIHNQSATKTANSITIGMETLTDANPTVIGQFQLSTDNATWANSVTIPNLAPGATSAVIYVRDSPSAGAALGLWAARIVAAAGSFT